MSQPISKSIALSLKHIYEGPSWHGPAIKEILSRLSVEDMLKSVSGSHNVIELLEHMIVWRQFVIHRLKGNNEFEVTDEINFRGINEKDTEVWNATLKKLDNTQQELLALLEGVSDDKLKQQVPNKDYNFFFMLSGSIHHDLYHLGQLTLLAKQ